MRSTTSDWKHFKSFVDMKRVESLNSQRPKLIQAIGFQEIRVDRSETSGKSTSGNFECRV
jgi:hypothetical protein